MCVLINKKENIFGDNIASAEHWDFSRSNLNDSNRIAAITRVASICYQNPKVLDMVENGLGSEALYNRLSGESNGLPSSSFEFVPVLLTWGEVISVATLIETNVIVNTYGSDIDTQTAEIEKFGQWIEVDGCKYLLTNYRAIVYDFEKYGDRGVDLRRRHNTEVECDIIKQHYQVFRFKVDFPTRSQMVRHRVNLQELSRRYVSGKRVKFEHYISKNMKDVKSTYKFTRPFREAPIDTNDDLTGSVGEPIGCLMETIEISVGTQDVIDICMNHYYKSLEDGVKPQEARRIIPQTGYTKFWMGFLPYQLENFFRLRDDSHAQWEVRQAAIAMKNMMGITLTTDTTPLPISK
jgi:thymidylate synthase (FAD)